MFHDSPVIIEKSAIINATAETRKLTYPFELNGSVKTSFIDLSVKGPKQEEVVANLQFA
jgi:hypothetical protein